MNNFDRIRSVVLLVAVLALGLPAHAQLLNDTLQGSTTGTRSGGTFVTGGWRVDNQYDSIYWHVPTFPHGAFEFNVKGIPGGLSGCPGGAGFKSEISHMYDYTYNNADNQYLPGYGDDPHKQFLRKQCESGKTDTMEIVWQVPPPGNFAETDTAALSWCASLNYLFRVEWQNAGGNTTLKTYRNGILILTQTLPGSWNPAGQSVRIGASTRRANEGAVVGSIYSNVKVYDLNSTLPPGAPTITAPASGETINTTLAYVQWSGDLHTQYQMRINGQNDPDVTIIYDSQQVSSSRSFAWSGVLSNNVTYYAFVRVAGAGGWGPWSAGRSFTVNTAFVPAGINYVKVKGNTLVNNSGPFLGLGFSHFRALQRRRSDPTRYASDLAFMASKGFRYQRALSMVAWCGLEIAPVSFTSPCGGTITAWSDYDQVLKDAIDIAYDTYGIKTELTIFADAQWVMPPDSASNATRTAHLDRILNDIVGREHKIILLEVGNELWQNGVSNLCDVQTKGQYLADRTPIPVALSATTPDVSTVNAGSAADIATIHFSRDTGTVEGGWLPVRDCYDYAYLPFVPPASSNEPIGPGSSVSAENDPIKLCMAGCFAWTAGLPSYVYHSKAGIQGWSGCCPPSGTEQLFPNMAGVGSYMNIFPLLPGDLASWERNDGKAAASPFTNYSNGQANKWWPEVGGATSGCVRNISTIKGAEFVTCPIGILSGGLTIQARRPLCFTAYNPLTGAAAYNLCMNIGEQFTLAQGPGAYVIKGVFTDIQIHEPFIDMGCTDIVDGLTNIQGGDGNTVCVTIGGRDCRRNADPNSTNAYFYFGVSDAWAYQGSKPDVYILMEYYDTGTSTIALEYDSSTGTGIPAYYRVGGSVSMTNTLGWKSATFHLTDAYFANRENGGADFRFADPNNTYYLDRVWVTQTQPVPPIINQPPSPQITYPGVPYTLPLTLSQGHPAPTWSLTLGPPGAAISAAGQVSGWTPGAGSFGNYNFTAQATNPLGSDSKSWVVRVLSRTDFDQDGDTDLSDFAFMQRCFSGDAYPHEQGCDAPDLDLDGDVDTFDFAAFVPCMRGTAQTPGC